MPRQSLPRFNLKNSKSKTPTTVVLIYRYKKEAGKNVTLRHSTGETVLPKFWQGDSARINLTYPDYPAMNTRLADLRVEALRIAKKEPFISVPAFKKRLDVFMNRAPAGPATIPTLPKYIDDVCRSPILDYKTIKKHQDIKNKLNRYGLEKSYDLYFENITLDFRNDFVKWLYANGVNSRNTMHKITQRLRKYMKDSANETIVVDGVMQRYHNCTDHNKDGWLENKIKSTKHYLEQRELNILAAAELTTHNNFALTRDCFLIMCYTGLRISDLKKLTKDHIFKEKRGYYIDTYTKKGRNVKFDTQVVVPIIKPLEAILKRLDFNIPDTISEQKLNDHIKEILKELGVNRKVLHLKQTRGHLKEQFTPIYKLITNHSGRYTFIDLMLNQYEIPILRVQKMTGLSLKVLMEYERGNKHKSAMIVLDSINSGAKIRNL